MRHAAPDRRPGRPLRPDRSGTPGNRQGRHPRQNTSACHCPHLPGPAGPLNRSSHHAGRHHEQNEHALMAQCASYQACPTALSPSTASPTPIESWAPRVASPSSSLSTSPQPWTTGIRGSLTPSPRTTTSSPLTTAVSAPPPGRFPDSIEAMADDAYTFIKSLGFDSIDVFSFSLGAWSPRAWWPSIPALFANVLLEPAPGRAAAKTWTGLSATTYLDICARHIDALGSRRSSCSSTATPTGKPVREGVYDAPQERTVDRDRPHLIKAFRTQLKAIKNFGRSAPVGPGPLTHPTLIVTATTTAWCHQSSPRTCTAASKDSELIIYPDAGHGSIFQFHDASSRRHGIPRPADCRQKSCRRGSLTQLCFPRARASCSTPRL